MQTFDQSSDKPEPSQNAGEAAGIFPNPPSAETQAAMPADAQSPRSPSTTRDEQASPRDEDILAGLVYPPPPSFYSKAQPEVRKAHTHTTPVATAASATVPPRVYPASYHATWPPAGSTPPRPQSAVPGVPFQQYYPAQARKKSHTWIWILVCTLIAVVLGSCGLIAWVGYSLFGPSINSTVSDLSKGQDQATAYFDALQSKDYTQAYSYLSPQGSIAGLTQNQFTQRAQDQDQRYGPVQSYTLDAANVSTASDGTIVNFSIPVDVSRPHKSQYQVTLIFHHIGNTWKITDFNAI